MKFYGEVGYVETEETAPGVYEEVSHEILCRGDITRNSKKWEQGIGLNDDINISNQFSLVLHPLLLEHFINLRYIHWMGTNWKITSIELAPPRLIIQVGGVYNGSDQRESSEGTGEDTGVE